jgi:hypothetical protein
MKNSMINKSHIEGVLYQHDLELKVTGENSKNPGTEFISGNIEIATDDAGVNIVPVHFTYVTATTSKGKANASFQTLNDIITGKLGTVMKDGADKAAKLRIDSAIGLNEFYSDRNGQEELVSVKRNEGGFIHVVNALNEDEKTRNTFEVDMIITNVTRIEANEERQTPEKVIVRGTTFNFRNDILPIELSVTNPNAMDYFEGLGASSKEPVFTRVKGRQVSETVVRTITEESAFGEDSVREVKSTRKDFVITWAMKEPYVWDDESTITAAELSELVAKRETDLAAMKARSDEYKASRNGGAAAAAPKAGGFDF